MFCSKFKLIFNAYISFQTAFLSPQLWKWTGVNTEGGDTESKQENGLRITSSSRLSSGIPATSLSSEPFLLSPKMSLPSLPQSFLTSYKQTQPVSSSTSTSSTTTHDQSNRNNNNYSTQKQLTSNSIQNVNLNSDYSAAPKSQQMMNNELSNMRTRHNIYDEFDDNVKNTNVSKNNHNSNGVGIGTTQIYHERRDLNEISNSVDCPQILNVNNASEVLERVLQELELIRRVKEGNSTPEGTSLFYYICWYFYLVSFGDCLFA